MVNLKNTLEALLFVSSKPLKLDFLAKHLQVTKEDLQAAFSDLQEERKDSGVVLTIASENYQLATNPELAEVITKYLTSDLREKLTDAQLEVLAIIAYRGSITKAEIEAIRGVNSQYALRQLLMRGLVEKKPAPGDLRMINYEVTTEFMQHFGISSITELPEYERIIAQVKLPEKQEKADSAEAAAQQEPQATEQVIIVTTE